MSKLGEMSAKVQELKREANSLSCAAENAKNKLPRLSIEAGDGVTLEIAAQEDGYLCVRIAEKAGFRTILLRSSQINVLAAWVKE